MELEEQKVYWRLTLVKGRKEKKEKQKAQLGKNLSIDNADLRKSLLAQWKLQSREWLLEEVCMDQTS